MQIHTKCEKQYNQNGEGYDLVLVVKTVVNHLRVLPYHNQATGFAINGEKNHNHFKEILKNEIVCKM